MSNFFYHHERPNYLLILIIFLAAIGSTYTVLVNNPHLIMKTQLKQGIESNQKPHELISVYNSKVKSDTAAPPIVNHHLNQVQTRLSHVYVPDKEIFLSVVFPQEWDLSSIRPESMNLRNDFMISEGGNSLYILNLKDLSSFAIRNVQHFASSSEQKRLAYYVDHKTIFWLDNNNVLHTAELPGRKVLQSQLIIEKNILHFFNLEEDFYILSQSKSNSVKLTKIKSQKIEPASHEISSRQSEIFDIPDTVSRFKVYKNWLFMTSDQSLFKLDLKRLKTNWIHPLVSPINNDFLVTKSHVYLATTEGQFYSLKTKNGEKDWEYQLTAPAKGNPTFVPHFNRVAVMATDGYIHTVDAFTGERRWRLKLKFPPNNGDVLSINLNNFSKRNLGLTSRFGAWSIWAGCGLRTLCIFGPENGQIIGKFETTKSIQSAPLFFNRSFALITKEKDELSSSTLPNIFTFINP